jgi:hypothetical protein
MLAMAPRTPTQQAIEFGEHLTKLHKADGEPSFGVMSRTILLATDGHLSVSDQQLGNMHKGKTDPTKCRVEVLIALCRFYGVPSAALGPVAAAEIAAVTDLTASDQAFARTRCRVQSAVAA